MAFQFKSDESVRDGALRVAKRELAKALEELRSRGREDEAVHEVRKSLKKVRSVLRLIRDELGERVYRRENLSLRDAARPLTEVRDAAVLVVTLDALIDGAAGDVTKAESDQVRTSLVRDEREVTQRVLTEGRAFATVARAIGAALARVPAWTIRHDGWAALAAGLERVYRAGHRAFEAAMAEPTSENLHEWRKQAKYLWHELQLLEPAWIAGEKRLGEQVHEVTRLLGDDHDLTLLRGSITAHPLAHGGHRALKRLVSLIDRRRRVLREKAFALGRQVYGDSPKAFATRIEGYWKTWRAKADRARRPSHYTPTRLATRPVHSPQQT